MGNRHGRSHNRSAIPGVTAWILPLVTLAIRISRVSVLRVQDGVQATPGFRPRDRLHGARLGVAPEQQPRMSGQVGRLDDLAVGQADKGPRGHVAVYLDDPVVLERDANDGV